MARYVEQTLELCDKIEAAMQENKELHGKAFAPLELEDTPDEPSLEDGDEGEELDAPSLEELRETYDSLVVDFELLLTTVELRRFHDFIELCDEMHDLDLQADISVSERVTKQEEARVIALEYRKLLVDGPDFGDEKQNEFNKLSIAYLAMRKREIEIFTSAEPLDSEERKHLHRVAGRNTLSPKNLGQYSGVIKLPLAEDSDNDVPLNILAIAAHKCGITHNVKSGEGYAFAIDDDGLHILATPNAPDFNIDDIRRRTKEMGEYYSQQQWKKARGAYEFGEYINEIGSFTRILHSILLRRIAHRTSGYIKAQNLTDMECFFELNADDPPKATRVSYLDLQDQGIDASKLDPATTKIIFKIKGKAVQDILIDGFGAQLPEISTDRRWQGER